MIHQQVAKAQSSGITTTSEVSCNLSTRCRQALTPLFISHLLLACREGLGVISHKLILMAFPKALVMELVKEILGDFPHYDTSEESEAAGMYMVNYQCYKAPSTSLLPLYWWDTLCMSWDLHQEEIHCKWQLPANANNFKIAKKVKKYKRPMTA